MRSALGSGRALRESTEAHRGRASWIQRSAWSAAAWPRHALTARPSEPCGPHRAGLAMAREYRHLRAELGAVLPRADDRWGR
jgi:hypothetical protein